MFALTKIIVEYIFYVSVIVTAVFLIVLTVLPQARRIAKEIKRLFNSKEKGSHKSKGNYKKHRTVKTPRTRIVR